MLRARAEARATDLFIHLFLHAAEAWRGILSARFARKFRPLRPLAKGARTAGIRAGIAVDGSQTAWRPSIFNPLLQGTEAVELRIEPAVAVGEAGNHVKPHKTVEAQLSKPRDLSLVVRDGIVRCDEIVRRAVRHDDLAALRAKLLEAYFCDVHDRRNSGDARLVLLRIELKRIELRIARENELYCLISGAVEKRFSARDGIRWLRVPAKVGRSREQRAFEQTPFRKRIRTCDGDSRLVIRRNHRNRSKLRVRQAVVTGDAVRTAQRPCVKRGVARSNVADDSVLHAVKFVALRVNRVGEKLRMLRIDPSCATIGIYGSATGRAISAGDADNHLALRDTRRHGQRL